MFLRRGGGSGGHLEWRARILGVGAVVALAGIGTEREWLVNVAIGILVLGFGLRFLPGGGDEGDSGSDEAPEG
ncbi:MAG TPA: hypothetical protein VLA43_14385 [Longimicrobiales bacterium]|nr:hypothetical protein [Longimicrobiales bacterium]